MPGEFPEHDEKHLLLKNVTEWKSIIHAPSLVYPDEEWDPYIRQANEIDRNQYFVATCMMPGIFERLHHFMDIPQTMMNFYEEPEAMHDLINYITDWEMEYADIVCAKLHPDALFHHDDWGTQKSTFMSPEMFEEFLFPAYKKLYHHYHDLGVKLIIHHSDSYAATLVPYMIEMGIDIWQGVMTSNNIPELIKKYGGQISFMGGIDSAKVDYEGWTREVIRKEVRKACDENGSLYFIPNASQGLDISTYPGVYETISEEIEAYSKEVF
jgi:uroporphyrinogen-III decarboxylase